jgi:adenosine deaminase
MAGLFLIAAAPAGTSAELATAAHLASIAHDPVALREFFSAMPKGADLHNHIDGAVDAERFVDWAAHDGLCYDPASLALSSPPCAGGHVVRAGDGDLRRRLIDAFTMRDFVPVTGESGHDHFFAAFGKFGAASAQHQVDMLLNAAGHAGLDRLDYVEFMITDLAELPEFRPALADVSNEASDARILAAVRPLLPAAVAHAKARIAATVAGRTAYCASHGGEPACRPAVRYIIEVIRTLPFAQVVAQTALAFALARVDPNVVGVNFVAPEDDPATLATYARQMRLVAMLQDDPARPVHISLHAGELSLALVPRADLRDHIATAVGVAGAERIGHGVDVAFEDDAPALLARMAKTHVLVEIALTSNDVILGVRGAAHPLPAYLAAGVPVALATDDEGVSRIDLTNEFVRAERDYDLPYPTIKTMVRNSVEYAFAPGTSLWIDHDYTVPVAACATFAEPPTQGCATLLQDSLKMRLQYRLEEELRAFEAAQAR